MHTKYTRRHSPNLVPVQREPDRVPFVEESVHHRLPWNKYCQEWPTRQRIRTEISRPSREEFVQIKRWSTEKRMQEERRFQLAELQRISAERRAQRQLEASRRLKHNSVLEEIRHNRERRIKLQQERTEIHSRYLDFRRTSKSAAPLHEARQRIEDLKWELYTTKVRPFKTLRPRQILETDALKRLGKFSEISYEEIPFELNVQRRKQEIRSRSLPPPSVTSPDKIQLPKLKAPAAVDVTAVASDRKEDTSTTESLKSASYVQELPSVCD